jgi:cytochrome c
MKALIAAISATTLLALSIVAQAAGPPADPVTIVKQVKGDCLACHSVDKKVVGPGWNSVSAKYKGDKTAQAMLVAKVIKGGKGNWDKVTGGMAMTPHPAKPSNEEIGKIVAAILTL